MLTSTGTALRLVWHSNPHGDSHRDSFQVGVTSNTMVIAMGTASRMGRLGLLKLCNWKWTNRIFRWHCSNLLPWASRNKKTTSTKWPAAVTADISIYTSILFKNMVRKEFSGLGIYDHAVIREKETWIRTCLCHTEEIRLNNIGLQQCARKLW